jgi:molybdopterin-synthase adenylyltransferase
MPDKYSRQTKVIGKIKGTIAIVGLGALGSVAANLLARSGLNLILIDRDLVELTNLQRQLYNEDQINQSKAIATKNNLQKINSKIKITPLAIHLNQNNIKELKKANIILDCTDNLQTRFLINDYAKKNKIPWIYSAAIKTSGYVMPILQKPNYPCLSCFLKPANLETCETSGVLNTITNAIASIQTTLAIKILKKQPTPPNLYHLDIYKPELKTIKIKQNKSCPTCNNQYNYLNQKNTTIKFCSSSRYQFKTTLTIKQIKEKIKHLKPTEDEVSIQTKDLIAFKDKRILIKAKDEKQAQSIFSKLIGN